MSETIRRRGLPSSLRYLAEKLDGPLSDAERAGVALTLNQLADEAEQATQRGELVELLRGMDRTQRETDEDGGREVAWYYYRDQIEDALSVDRGTLDTGERQSLADIMASVREQAEAQGGTWPLKPPPGFGPTPHEEPTARAEP